MNKVLLGGASALALLAFGSAAQAQSISDTIGVNLIGLQGAFEGGNWINESLNVGAIDGSVVLRGQGFSGAVDVDLGSITVDADLLIEAAAGAGGDLDLLADLLDLLAGGEISLEALLAVAVAAGIDLDVALGVDLGTFAGNLTTGGSIVSTDTIETLAAGAINTGDIASAVATAAESTGTSFDFSFEGGSFSDINEATAAANTSTTASSASATNNVALEVGGISASFAEFDNSSNSGPLTDIYAANRAFNNAGIDASVSAIANSVSLDGIGTTAAGAINTGTISLGFDGSAFADLAEIE